MGRASTFRDHVLVKTSRSGHAVSRSRSADSAKISPKSIAAHALATFGSREKTQHWMNRPNPLFHGKTPLEVMQTDPVSVEAELVRIDHGVYV